MLIQDDRGRYDQVFFIQRKKCVLRQRDTADAGRFVSFRREEETGIIVLIQLDVLKRLASPVILISPDDSRPEAAGFLQNGLDHFLH